MPVVTDMVRGMAEAVARLPAGAPLAQAVLDPITAPLVGVRSEPGADVGEEVTVTWGEELYTPIEYSSFRVGPFTAKTVVRPGEARREAMWRLWQELSEFAVLAYTRKRDGYLARLRGVSAAARER